MSGNNSTRWAGQTAELSVYGQQNGATARLETLGAEGGRTVRSPVPGRRPVGSGCPSSWHWSDLCNQETHFHLCSLLQHRRTASPVLESRDLEGVYSDPTITEQDKMNSHSTLEKITCALSGKFFDLMKDMFRTDK